MKLTIARAEPCQVVAAEQSTVDVLLAELRRIEDRLHRLENRMPIRARPRPVDGMQVLLGKPVVVDPDLPPGAVKLRPHEPEHATPEAPMILNLTPHPIRLYTNERNDGIDDLALHLREVIEPEPTPARLTTIQLGTQAGGIELVEYGHAHNLPPRRAGVRYVVSLVVALALTTRRSDLLVPYREVRNASGTVIGCRQLAQPV